VSTEVTQTLASPISPFRAAPPGGRAAATAQHRAREIEVDQHRNTFYDRTRGRITLDSWQAG
jgi:hypothetical protein